MTREYWFVHILVNGHYAGADRFDSEKDARDVAREKTRTMSRLGCFYEVTDSDIRPRDLWEL